MVGFEDIDAKGMSSQRGHAGSLGSMPLVAMLLILLFTLTACHSHRQSTESLTLLQRRQSQLSYCDTVWQQLSLQLDGLTLEWPERPENPSFIEGVRLTAAHGTMHLQDQKKTELQTFEACRDTVRLAHLSEQSTAMPSTQERKGRKGGCWVVGLVLGLLGMVFFIIWKRKTL